MVMIDYYKAVLQKYAEFTGRARRREYWYFVLANLIVSIIVSIVGSIVNLDRELSTLYSLAVLVPSIAVGVRRLHDTSRSGWWMLLALIPIVGWIVLIIFFVLDSDPGANAYGPNPKGDTVAAPAPEPAPAPVASAMPTSTPPEVPPTTYSESSKNS